jgi:predicted RNA polymerase sigma factor
MAAPTIDAPIAQRLQSLERQVAEGASASAAIAAIAEARALAQHQPCGEVWGLLALLLLPHDRDEGLALVDRALDGREAGPFALRAAIAALQQQAQVDWQRVAGLCELLVEVDPCPRHHQALASARHRAGTARQVQNRR